MSAKECPLYKLCKSHAMKEEGVAEKTCTTKMYAKSCGDKSAKMIMAVNFMEVGKAAAVLDYNMICNILNTPTVNEA